MKMQEMAWHLKGKVAECNRREYGYAKIQVNKIGNGADVLFEQLGDELEVRGKVVSPYDQIYSPLKVS